ncbi:hypothetical protein ACFSTE_22410 [Aquimarina hainanensis]|uniref:Uncharacterized protein n=1 Tax=Aquimarina hainanensis TaxID=1578017 RepID=A0ABW5NE41_9FLAO
MEILTFIAAIISLFGGLVTKIARDREKRKEQPRTIEKQIEDLDSVSKSLENLKDFIEEQKNSLKDNERTIQELESEKEKLKPIVETQKATVEAILKAHSTSQKRARWFDYLMGFFIGVASSAIVSLVFYYFQNGK